MCQLPWGPARRTVFLKVSNLAEMGLAEDEEALMISGPAWPGGEQEPSAGGRADAVPHLCFPPPVLGRVEPCKWDSSPKACCTPA